MIWKTNSKLHNSALLLLVGVSMSPMPAIFAQGVGSGAGQSGSATGSQSTGQQGAGSTGQSYGTAGQQSNGAGPSTGDQASTTTSGLSTTNTTGNTNGNTSAGGSMGGNVSSSMSGALSNQSSEADQQTSSLTLSSGLPINNNGPAVYNLSDSIQATINSSSDLALAEKALDRDRALVAVSNDDNHPKLNASANYVHLDSPISIPFAGNKIVVQPDNTQTFAATGTLPLDISGQVRAATQAAQLQVMEDRFNLDRIKNALVLNAQTAYFNDLRAQHQVEVAQSALQDAQTQLKTSQTQFAGGIGQKIDVYRASTQVAQAQQSLLQATNALALAQNNFNDVVGRNLTAPVVVEDVPGVSVGTTIGSTSSEASVGAPETGVSDFFTPPSTELDQIKVQSDIDQALKARPELREDLVSIQAAAKQIVIARATSEPSLSLSATGDYYPVTDFQTPRHSLGVFSATVSIPIFDGGISHDRERAAKDEKSESQISYESDQTNVELQVREAYLNLYTASNQIASANTALEEAIAARQLAEVRYANGVGLYLEVTDAEAALTNAENSQVNAVYDYLIARAKYQNALGTPNTDPTL